MYNELNTVKMIGNKQKSTIFGTIKIKTQKIFLNFLREIQWKR